jgi:hypothetical protein
MAEALNFQHSPRAIIAWKSLSSDLRPEKGKSILIQASKHPSI